MLNWQGWAANFLGWGSAASAPPAVVAPYPGPAGRSRGRKRHRSLVEIDGELHAVEGRAQAEALLEDIRAKAREEAPKAAKRALNRARKVERQTGEMPVVEVTPPQIRVVDATEALTADVERQAQQIAQIYQRALESAELAYRARRAYFEREQQEEDDIETLIALGIL